jgi:hypothetical protein
MPGSEGKRAFSVTVVWHMDLEFLGKGIVINIFILGFVVVSVSINCGQSPII